MATALLYTISALPHLQTIEHKFLETGHTQLECDSMHAAIEFAKKNTQIFVPSQWDTVFRMARRRSPYTVVPKKTYQLYIYDLKDLAGRICRNVKITRQGERVNWMKVKVVKVCNEKPHTLLVKEDFDSDFKEISAQQTLTKRGRPTSELSEKIIKQKYSARLRVSDEKKKDLISLCQSLAIPFKYHAFYNNIPSSKSTRDRVASPDVDEADNDTTDGD